MGDWDSEIGLSWSHPLVRPRGASSRSLIATQKATTKLSVSHDFFLTSHFPTSTAPQAFPRPDRGKARPARADAVKTGRFSAATRRLGLYSIEHDGTMAANVARRGPQCVISICSSSHSAWCRRG